MLRTMGAIARFTGLFLAVALGTAGVAHADRLKDIKDRGSLVCATLSGSEPLAYQDPATRQYVGFDVDTCSAIARHLGVKMEHKPITVEARIPELTLGRVDVVAAAFGYTKERAEQVAFTSSHYQIPLKIIVAKDSGITRFSDLAGKRISTEKGSTPELYARRVIPSAEVVTFQDNASQFLALQQGKVQGFAIGMASGLRFVNGSDGKYKFLDESLANEPTCLGVKKGEPELLAAVNKALDDMQSSGELDALWNKWYGPQTKFNIPRGKLIPVSSL